MDAVIKVATLPLPIVWADVEKNIGAVEAALKKLQPGTDILVLPELFTSGFIQDTAILTRVARDYREHTLQKLHQWAGQYNLALAGSFACEDNGVIYNRGFFIEPGGEATFYDKHHLFCLSPESRLMGEGRQLPPVIRFRGWNISMIVCYDLRFPAWCRNRGEQYDMLLVPANWPRQRGYAWEHLLIARAIENQAVVVGGNRSGSDEYGDYDNLSFIFDPLGKPLAPNAASVVAGQPDEPAPAEMLYARYNIADVARLRRKLPVGHDADDIEINIR